MRSKKGRKEMNTIIAAYITFNTEEGHDEAENFLKNPRKYITLKDALGDKFLNKFFKNTGGLNIKKPETYENLKVDHLNLLGQRMRFT